VEPIHKLLYKLLVKKTHYGCICSVGLYLKFWAFNENNKHKKKRTLTNTTKQNKRINNTPTIWKNTSDCVCFS